VESELNLYADQELDISSNSRSPNDHFLHRTPVLGTLTRASLNGKISYEILLKQKILAVHHDFHLLLIPYKLQD